MDRPQLGVEAEPPPEVAVVLEAEAMIRREQRGRGSGGGRTGAREAHPAERHERRQWKRDQEQIPDQVEHRAQVDDAGRETTEGDDGEMRQLLVIEEDREAEL